MSSGSPRVSVVVPVYNGRGTLARCVESLRRQTLPQVEIVLVDDLSTDGSREALRTLAAEDPRITVILRDVNGGPSAARNMGISAARGEYVGFVDVDDFVAPDMFEKLTHAAENHGADVAACGHRSCGVDGETLAEVPVPIPAGRRLDHAAVIELLTRAHRTRCIWFACRSIYARRMLLDRALKFDEGVRYGEDALFNLQAFFHARAIVAVDEPLYGYVENPASATRARYKPFLESSVVTCWEKKVAFYDRHGLGGRTRSDLAEYVSYHLLPMLLANAVARGDGSSATERVRSVLALEPVRSSLRGTPLFDATLPVGIQAIVTMARLNLVRFLERFVTSRR